MPQEGLLSYCQHIPYTHRCQDCDRIHVCCEHCNQIIETIKNECPKCRLYKGQGVYSSNHPASAAPGLDISHDRGGTSGDGRLSSSSADCCQKRSIQTYRSGNVTGAYPDSVQLGVEGRVDREGKGDGTTVFPVKDAKAQDTDYPIVNHGNHLVSSHPLDDPLFDHPDLKFIRDVNKWAVHVDNSTESASPQYHQEQKITKGTKTPAKRNKNCLPKKAGLSRPSGTSSNEMAAGKEERKQGSEGQQLATGDRLINFKETMSGLGLVVKDVTPDGNCFFAAVVDQLRVRGDFYHTTRSLREAAVDYLRANPNQEDGTPLQEFISDEGITSWVDYLNKQSKEGTWADHIIIGAISSVLRRRLVIYSTRNTHPPINITVVKPRKVQAEKGGSPNYEETTNVTDEESTCFESRSSIHISHQNKLDMEQDTFTEQAIHSKLTEKVADVGNAFEDLVSEIHTSHTDRSLQTKSNQVKFKQTDRDTHPSERKAGSDSGDIKSTSSDQWIAPRPKTENSCDRSLTDDTLDFHEDLLLGHIPEAHYFSLRLNDWCEKLYNVYDNADEQNDAENNTSADILSDDHLNFLLKYIQDGNFLVKSERMKNEYVVFQQPFQQWYACRGVGDRFNDLESYLWTDQVNNSSDCFDEEGVPQIWYTIYPNDILVSKEEKVVGQKQLIPDETGCKIGYLKLRPKNPSIWRNNVQPYKAETFLQHLYLREDLATNEAPKTLSLKCDWPENALESKERLLKFQVKSMDDTHQRIGEAVRVLPVCSHGAFCTSCVEWQYSFAVIEYIICKTIITSESRFCYKVMHQFLKFIFEGSRMMSKDVTKAVFFHIVDGLDIGNNEPSFIDIFQSFLLKLKVFLGANCIPDFFFRTKNLVCECSFEEIRWYYARICVVSRHYLVYIFMFLDITGLMSHFGLSQCFESLLYNSQHDADNAQKCFISLAVMEAKEWVISPLMVGNFGKARLLIDRYFDNYAKDSERDSAENCAIDELHKQVLFNLPLQEQWLYAFYLEYTSGTPYLDYVCQHHQSKDLGEYFGESVVQILITDRLGHLRNQKIPLPIEIVRQEGIASFAVQFVNSLKFQLPLTQSVNDASAASIYYFLTQHTDMILTNFTQNDRCDNIVSFQKTLSSLFQLFNILCHQYQCHQQGMTMDLLCVYDKLCSCSPSASGYEWLSKEWARIGNTYKAQEAQMKANSLRSVGTTIF